MTDAWVVHEPAIRLGGFLGVLLAMALWETAAPRRRREVPRLLRWSNNFAIVAIDTIVVRLTIPVLAVGMAVIARDRGSCGPPSRSRRWTNERRRGDGARVDDLVGPSRRGLAMGLNEAAGYAAVAALAGGIPNLGLPSPREVFVRTTLLDSSLSSASQALQRTAPRRGRSPGETAKK